MITPDQAKELLHIIGYAYPGFPISKPIVETWTSFINKLDPTYEQVKEAIEHYIATQEWAPKISHIINGIGVIQSKSFKSGM